MSLRCAALRTVSSSEALKWNGGVAGVEISARDHLAIGRCPPPTPPAGTRSYQRVCGVAPRLPRRKITKSGWSS